MARIKVTVTASESSLRLEGDKTFEYLPKDVVSIGNSIGGYLVAPMLDKPYVWGWWRIGGAMVDRLRSAPSNKNVTVNGRPPAGSRDGLVQLIMSSEPERVAVNGRQYLFAITSGSARHGVLHAYQPSTDPIRLALESVGCDLNTGRIATFDEIDHLITSGQFGGFLSGGHATTAWNSCYAVASDGAKLEFHWHGSQGAVGRLEKVTDYGPATYVIQLYEGWDGVSCHRVVTVAVAPNADRQAVAEAITKLVCEKARLSGPERKLASV